MTNRKKKTALLASVTVSVAAMLMSANAMAADLAPPAPAPTAEEAIAAASLPDVVNPVGTQPGCRRVRDRHRGRADHRLLSARVA